MLTLASSVSLAVLAVICKRAAGSWLFPPVLVAGYWSLVLLLLFLSKETFYHLTAQTLTVYMVGITAFTIGSLFSPATDSSERFRISHERRKPYIDKVLSLGILISITLLPFYIRHLQMLSETSGVSDFWVGLRYQTSVLDPVTGFGVWEYYVSLCSFLAVAKFYESDSTKRGRIETIALIVIALGVNMTTASRLGALTLVFALVAIAIFKAGRVRVRTVALGLVATLGVFGALALWLGKGADRNSSWSENIGSIAESIQLYLLGGPVAFDRYIQGFAEQEEGPRTFRFVLQLAGRLFDYDVTLPSSVLNYTPTPTPTNVYTAFFAYYSDFGLTGVAVIMGVMGFAFTTVYRLAKQGHPVWVIVYGYFAAYVFISVANEAFISTTSVWIQVLFFATILYFVPLPQPASQGGAPDRNIIPVELRDTKAGDVGDVVATEPSRLL
ncbi:MAG: O-antigen polymerase [Thermomicrobiales bacterium]